jgi:hypothetical protein
VASHQTQLLPMPELPSPQEGSPPISVEVGQEDQEKGEEALQDSYLVHVVSWQVATNPTILLPPSSQEQEVPLELEWQGEEDQGEVVSSQGSALWQEDSQEILEACSPFPQKGPTPSVGLALGQKVQAKGWQSLQGATPLPKTTWAVVCNQEILLATCHTPPPPLQEPQVPP